MDHKITINRARTFSEIVEVENKIRNSNCAKKNAPLNQFNWFIRSGRMHPGNIIIAYLVAKTRGVCYFAEIINVPQDIIDYWGVNNVLVIQLVRAKLTTK
jgi:hypothetical protein